MHARSALFDLYGDHLRSRGGCAPVAALVRLLAPVGIASPAVRTAVSRMVRQGWLEPVRLPAGPGYSLTPRAGRRLDEAASRIYGNRARDPQQPWPGTWHVVVTAQLPERGSRQRVAAGLGYLGYAPLGEATWIAPRPSPELDGLLRAEGVHAEGFDGSYQGDPAALARRAWDLDGLSRAYRRWLEQARTMVESSGGDPGDEEAFAVRFRLVHEWRKFLFLDPGLPPSVLPEDWSGQQARNYFDAEASRLLPAASRYVEACLRAAA